MDISELFKFNEWWETKKVNESHIKTYKRYLYLKLLKFLPDRQMILITGLRRTGKTVLLYQLIQHLLDAGVSPRKILYFSFDEENFDIKEVVEAYKINVLREEFNQVDKIYLFFDEVQKVEDWENKIKVYYDLYPNLKIFLSGSASLTLSRKSKESLAGRIYDFNLMPLTFKEFLEMKRVRVTFEDARLLNQKISLYFSDFMRKSGFPEIIDEIDDEKIKSYIKISVIERIIYRDIPKEFGKVDIGLLETLINLLFSNPGLVLNIKSLSQDLRRNKRTIMNYIKYLESSLLINTVKNFRPSVLASSRKNRKIYPKTSSLVFSLVDKFEGNILGKVLETMFCTEVSPKYYFRKNKKEIDFLLLKEKEILPIEIKQKVSGTDMKKFISIIKKLNLKKGIILTLDCFGVYEEDVKILIYPVWVFFLFKERILKNL